VDTGIVQRPVDPEEELRLMAQEVRDYVEAVLNSLAANIPKAVVLCQVERAKDAMLNQLYSSISAHSTGRIEELLQEDLEVKRRREQCQKQAAALSKLTRQLSMQEAHASSGPPGFSDSGTTGGPAETEDWRTAFEEAATVRSSSYNYSNSPQPSPRSASPSMNGQPPSRNSSYSDLEENDDTGIISRRIPGRAAPPPPPSMYKY
jgi:dynamin GTPase